MAVKLVLNANAAVDREFDMDANPFMLNGVDAVSSDTYLKNFAR